MERTNALKMRQCLGKVLRRLSRTGRPVLVEQNREPVAVLIRIEDYLQRFADLEADESREELVRRIKGAGIRLPKGRSAVGIIRELRAS